MERKIATRATKVSQRRKEVKNCSGVHIEVRKWFYVSVIYMLVKKMQAED
jgi:hypothetical protein